MYVFENEKWFLFVFCELLTFFVSICCLKFEFLELWMFFCKSVVFCTRFTHGICESLKLVKIIFCFCFVWFWKCKIKICDLFVFCLRIGCLLHPIYYRFWWVFVFWMWNIRIRLVFGWYRAAFAAWVTHIYCESLNLVICLCFWFLYVFWLIIGRLFRPSYSRFL